MIKKHVVNLQGIIFSVLEAEDFKRHRQVENIAYSRSEGIKDQLWGGVLSLPY